MKLKLFVLMAMLPIGFYSANAFACDGCPPGGGGSSGGNGGGGSSGPSCAREAARLQSCENRHPNDAGTECRYWYDQYLDCMMGG